MSARASTQPKLGRKFGGMCSGRSRLWKQSQNLSFFFFFPSPNHLSQPPASKHILPGHVWLPRWISYASFWHLLLFLEV